MEYEAIVIGSGPAGLNAALYLKRAGKKVVVIEKEYEGSGQMAGSIRVENYLGIPALSGEELGERFREHAQHLQVRRILEEEVVEDVTGGCSESGWQVHFSSGDILKAEVLIYAAGTVPGELGIPGEETYRGRGVSYCAYCDGSLYKGKDAAVVGGGDTALDDALYLSDLCRKVYLIHRRDIFRGNLAAVERLRQKENVEFLLNASLQEVYGEKKLEGIRLADGRTLNVSGLFVAVGSVPASDFIRDYVDRDEKGYVVAGEDGITTAPGLFVAGDVRTKKLRQIITAASDGANAASSAIQYIRLQVKKE